MEGKGWPPVVATARREFGTSLLKATFTDARIHYSVEGRTCEIDLVLARSQPGAFSLQF
jgi:hypothetical protein